MDTILQQVEAFGVNEGNADLFLPVIFINFILCALMAFVLRFIYERSSISLSGFAQISAVIPALSLIVFMVITIVKSSLALSLGLVGALSIVRLRTPIKEPQELIFLFASIAIGLGYGSGMTQVTTLLALSLLAYLHFIERKDTASLSSGLQLKISSDKEGSSKILFSIKSIIEKYDSEYQLLRLEEGSNRPTSVYVTLSIGQSEDINNLIEEINQSVNEAEISLTQDRINW